MVVQRTQEGRPGPRYGAVWLEEEVEIAWRAAVEGLSTEIRREKALVAVVRPGGTPDGGVQPMKVERPRLAQLRLF